MRVLMITGEYPPVGGGISDYVRLLAGALEAERIETTVLSGIETDADVQVERWSWNLRRTVERAIREHECDLVHIQYQAGAFDMHPAVNLLARSITSVPVVTTFHDLRVPYLFPKAGRLRFATIKRMARWSDAVIVSNPVDASILSDASIDATEIRLGPSLPAPNATSSSEHSVGFFGFPSRQKGFDLLVDALARIPSGERPRLVIVGRRPPEHGNHGFHSISAVEEMAAIHDIEIEWTGYLQPQDAANCLAATGVIAFPFPAGATLRSSALIAAASCGRPVVTIRPPAPWHLDELDSLPQVIQLLNPEPGKLANAIGAAIDQPSTQHELPDSLRWSTIARKHRQLYTDLVGS